TWIDRLDTEDVIVASGNLQALERCAPEAFKSRGPWSAFQIIEGAGDWGMGAGSDDDNAASVSASPESQAPSPLTVATILARAFAVSEITERLRLCREAVTSAPDSAVAHLALASASRENRDGTAAREALDRAAALA